MVVLNSSSLLGETGNGIVYHRINMVAELFAEDDWVALTFEEISTAAADNARFIGGDRNSLFVDDFEFGLGLSHTLLSGMQLQGEFRRFGRSVGGRVESIKFGTEETGFVELSGFEPFQSKKILNKTRRWLSGLDEETLFSGDDRIIGTQRFGDWEDGGTPELYGSDNLNGYAGNDYLDGNGGYDNIIGGEGRDTFVVHDFQAERGQDDGGVPHFLDFNSDEDYILAQNIDPNTLEITTWTTDYTILWGGEYAEGYTSVRQQLAYLPTNIQSLDQIAFT